MGWSPKAIVTDKPLSFILDFSDPLTNKRLHLLPYEFVVFQNGKEIARKSGLLQVGSDTQEFTFDRTGPVYFKVSNVGDKKSYSNFNSTVYGSNNTGFNRKSTTSLPTNPFKVSTLTLVWITYTIIAVIPAGVAVVYFLYRKHII